MFLAWMMIKLIKNSLFIFDLKGDLMKKNLCVSIIVTATILIMISDAHPLDINGWWKVNMSIEHADFVTGHWDKIHATGSAAAYIYLYNVNEYTFNGIGYLALPKGDGTWYLNIVAPGHYIVYLKNNIVVLFINSGQWDVDQASGSTLVLRAYGTTSATQLKGYYTEYDIENVGTPEQFVRMSSLNAMRVNADMVPDDVMDLIPH
jgi:hypothetical protein